MNFLLRVSCLEHLLIQSMSNAHAAFAFIFFSLLEQWKSGESSWLRNFFIRLLEWMNFPCCLIFLDNDFGWKSNLTVKINKLSNISSLQV